MMAPVARATVRALTWFLFQATRSTAIDAGRWTEIASRTATQSKPETLGLLRTRHRVDGSGPDQVGLAAAPLDDGEAEPGQAGVHAEHTPLEHPFARV